MTRMNKPASIKTTSRVVTKIKGREMKRKKIKMVDLIHLSTLFFSNQTNDR